MLKILRIFKTEAAYFAKKVTLNARRVIYSDMLFTVATPLTDIFLAAFIWRNTGSLLAAALYKIGEWIFLPITFYLNGHLLRRFTAQRLFVIGALLAGLSPLALIFFSFDNGYIILLCGCLYGVGNGFYWANRNYFEFNETLAKVRKYFFSLIACVSNLSRIIVPILAGWFIVFGQKVNWYTPNQAYGILFLAAFLLLAICGVIVGRGKFKPRLLDSLKVRTPIFWTKRRILNIAHGLIDGVGFVSGLLLFYFFGSEGALGAVLSLTAICVIVTTYIYGRFVRNHYQSPTLLASACLFLAGALVLAALPHAAGIFIYVIIISISSNFAVLASSPILLALSDQESVKFSNSRYAFIIDNELFLNFGRLIGASAIVALIAIGSQRTCLFYGPLVIAALHVIFIGIFFRKQI